MTDRAQFEAMLEALINEDQETAKEIFHNIVVSKSREIYEELLAEDFEEEEEVSEDGEEEMPVEEAENPFASSEEGDDEEGDDEEGDAADDEEGEEPFGDEEGAGGDMEDRVMDLEDALDELKAEFEELMGGEGDAPADDAGMDDMGMDDMGMDMGAEKEVDEFAGLMEYVDKVALPKHGDNGVQTRSPVAGKNDMGGTVANIARGGESGKAGTAGGLLKPTTSLQDGGNINKPGANAGKTSFKKKEPGHGAERKGSGDNGDKSAGSPINGAPGRAK